MTRSVLIWPDRRLRKKALPVIDFSGDIKQLKKDLLDTCRANDGAGLAAPQIGDFRRALVVGNTFIINPVLSINPLSKMISTKEGCLSLPGLFWEVTRRSGVYVTYQDETGAVHARQFYDTNAVIVQHENDHLDGKIFTDHLARKDREVALGSYYRMGVGLHV